MSKILDFIYVLYIFTSPSPQKMEMSDSLQEQFFTFQSLG